MVNHYNNLPTIALLSGAFIGTLFGYWMGHLDGFMRGYKK